MTDRKWKRAAFLGLALACLLLAALLAIELGLRVAAPARHDPEHVRAELERALARVVAAGGSSANQERAGRGILHPYTGWQPEADPGGVFAWFASDAHESELGVVVLGGNTALAWSRDHGPALSAELASSGTNVRLLPLAVDGWKEPQPLMALAFLLASGHRPAAVVVLDGPEELEIGLRNARAGFHPTQPDRETWSPLVLERGAFSPAELDLGTELWQARLAARAAISRALGSQVCIHSALLSKLALSRAEEDAARVERLGRDLDRLASELVLQRSERPELRGPPFDPDPCEALRICARSWEEAARSIDALCSSHAIAAVHVLAARATAKPEAEGAACTIANEGRRALAESRQALVREGIRVLDAAGVAEGSRPLSSAELGHEIARELRSKLGGT